LRIATKPCSRALGGTLIGLAGQTPQGLTCQVGVPIAAFSEGMLTLPSRPGPCCVTVASGGLAILLGGLPGLGAVGPGCSLVVLGSGFHASVEDAGEPAGEAAHRFVVADIAGTELVVEGAGSGGCGERGQRLGVQGVDEVPVADVPGVHGALLAG